MQEVKTAKVVFKCIKNIKEAVCSVVEPLNLKLPTEVLVKPNLVEGAPPGKSIATNVHVIEALIEWLKKRGVKKIVVADGSAHKNTRKEYIKAGYSLLNKLIDGFVDLNNDPKGYVKIKVPNPYELPEVEIAKTFYEAKYVIHVPVGKCHHICGLTCAIKGLMGVLAPRGLISTKDYIHREWTFSLTPRSKAKELFEKRLVDLLSAITSLKQQGFILVDGSYCCEIYEASPKVVKTDFVMASKDAIATDRVCAEVLGFEKKELPYLSLAEERLGKRKIKVVGDPLKHFKIQKPEGWQS